MQIGVSFFILKPTDSTHSIEAFCEEGVNQPPLRKCPQKTIFNASPTRPFVSGTTWRRYTSCHTRRRRRRRWGEAPTPSVSSTPCGSSTPWTPGRRWRRRCEEPGACCADLLRNNRTCSYLALNLAVHSTAEGWGAETRTHRDGADIGLYGTEKENLNDRTRDGGQGVPSFIRHTTPLLNTPSSWICHLNDPPCT